MLAEEPDGNLLARRRIPQRSQALVQGDEKVPLGGHTMSGHSSAEGAVARTTQRAERSDRHTDALAATRVGLGPTTTIVIRGDARSDAGFPPAARIMARSLICLDRHMLCGVYQESGICVRHHRRAEPPRDLG